MLTKVCRGKNEFRGGKPDYINSDDTICIYYRSCGACVKDHCGYGHPTYEEISYCEECPERFICYTSRE